VQWYNGTTVQQCNGSTAQWLNGLTVLGLTFGKNED